MRISRRRMDRPHAPPRRAAAVAAAALTAALAALACAAPGPAVEEPRPAAPEEALGDTDAAEGRDAAALDASAVVVQTIERFHHALSRGDTSAVLELLVPGARILEGGRIETRDEYAAHHLGADVEFLSGVTTDASRIQAWVEGDVAWAVARTESAMLADGSDLRVSSVELAVLVRDPDHGWRIAAVHWSSRRVDPE